MIAAERHKRILDLIERDHAISMASLRATFPVSTMTLWRDLERLEATGKIRRVRGGAVREGHDSETAISIKSTQRQQAKRRIAAGAVARFLRPGMSLIVDGGSTVAEVCPLLTGKAVSVLTHSLTILNRISSELPESSCHASGGILRPVSGTFVGPDAIRFFRKKQADLFFMTVTGLDQSNGLTDPNPLEIEVKRAMIQAAKQTVLLIDESKFGVSSLCPVVPLRRIDGLVTDCPNALDRIPELRSLALEFV